MTRPEAHRRLHAVHDELSAARFSLGHATKAVANDPSLLRALDYDLRPVMLGRCANKLDREYRNQIVHDRALVSLISFSTCKAALNKYISYFPMEW